MTTPQVTNADDTALSNPEAPVDPATPAEEGWMAPTPLLVEGCGPRGPDTSGEAVITAGYGSPANVV
ncbi:hypothetical protein O3P69_018932 [Scylla paramamosain]|uniref:Uncharacterized protein n=1 Tax=Scylla paramamosain TaxID=85552 RepID=A0AAW0SAD3_SCYPA